MPSSKAQTMESLTNLQAPNSLSKCKVAMLKKYIKGVMELDKGDIHDRPHNAWKPVGLEPTIQELELSTFPNQPPWGSLGFQKLVKMTCHSLTADYHIEFMKAPSKRCKTGKIFKLLSSQLKGEVELSKQGWLRGSFPAMRKLLSSSSQPLYCKGDYTLGIGLRSLKFLIWFALTYLTWSHSRARLLTELAVPLDPVQSLRRKVTVSSVAHQRMLMKWKQMAD